MGRLENIIARNLHPRGSRERFVVMISFGTILLVILGLMVFTDLGLPPGVRDAPPAAGPDHAGKRVNGVLLRAAPRETGDRPQETGDRP